MRDPRVDLERIVICAERVLEYTDALTFEEFVADGLPYDATLCGISRSWVRPRNA